MVLHLAMKCIWDFSTLIDHCTKKKEELLVTVVGVSHSA